MEYDFSEMLGPYAIGGICGTFVFVLYIIGLWKVFNKMGEKGWISLIPVYNFYVLYKRSWTGKAFVAVLIAVVASILLQMTPAYQNYNIFVDFLLKALNVLVGIIGLIMNIKLAKCFGKGILFGICLFILAPAFLLILGFGSARYYRRD